VYICLCNGFTDRQVRTIVEERASSVAQVYQALGCAPRCGKCVPLVREMLDRTAAGPDRGDVRA
jgi:bacterioferritin-associated ferredoxin